MSVWPRILPISASDSSRARITREQPSSAASLTPSSLVIDICVDAWISRSGRDRPDQPRQTQVLNDHRVHARQGQLAYRGFHIGELMGKDERIEGDISSDSPPVQQCHDIGQIVPFEVRRPDPRVVPLQPEINRVGPVLDGREQARPVSRRATGARVCG